MKKLEGCGVVAGIIGALLSIFVEVGGGGVPVLGLLPVF